MQPDADSILKTCTLSIWVCTYAMRDLRIQTGFLDKSVCKTLRLACVCMYMYKFMCVYMCGCDSFGKLTLVCVFFF